MKPRMRQMRDVPQGRAGATACPGLAAPAPKLETKNCKLKTGTGNSPQRGFTLLEMIVTVGVLSVVLAIIFPVVKSARTAALMKQARAEATALAQGAIRYKAEYGFWPGEMEYDAPDRVRPHASKPSPCGMIAAGPAEFTTKIQVSGSGPSGFLSLNTNEVFRAFSAAAYPAGGKYAANPLNPKAIQFLDLRNETDFDTVGFPDPWGEPYRLIMGLNPQSTFTFSVTKNNNPNPDYFVSVSNVTAFAFSLGPDRRNSTNYIYSAGVGP